MEKSEESVELSDGCMTELHGDQERNEDRLKQLDERVAVLRARMERLEDNIELSDCYTEEDEDRLELLEEKVAVLEVQNIELRNHLNYVIDGFNSVIQFLNDKYSTSSPIDTNPQHTVQQVYDMYQTQPPTEEDWQEMTDAIRAAEEYQTTPPQQLFNTINRFTDSEWCDLLQSS